MKTLRLAVCALAVVATPVVALADSYSAPASDAQAVELQKLDRDKKSHFDKKTGDKTVVWGRAEAFVNAPVGKTKEAVMDYGNYASFISRFQKSKLLKKDGQTAEVFLQLPILKGSATIWTLSKFGAPTTFGKGEMISATMLKGNVDDFQAVWKYRAVDDKHSVVTCELFVSPKLAVPDKVMIGQLEDACGEAVLGVRVQAAKLANSNVATK